MTKNTENKDYSNYLMNDFLQDDFFIYSMRNPTLDSIVFWEKQQAEHKENQEEFLLAKFYIDSVQPKNEILSEEDVNEVWNNIEKINEHDKKRHAINLRWGFSIAASIAIILSITFLFRQKQNVPDILSVAQHSNNIVFDKEQSQLIVAGNKAYLLDKAESTIVHDSTGITIDEKNADLSENDLSEASFNQLIISKGKRSNLILSDGTKVYVNAGTRIVYPAEFSKKKREIYVDGEIFLTVTLDKNRPFIVKTNTMDVEVLGTSFNILAYEEEDKHQVVLVSGSVKVHTNAKQEFSLRPNEMFSSNGGAVEIKKVDVENYISWISGYLTYNSERLDIILKHIAKYYGKEIVCDDASAQLRISGKIDLKDNLDQVLKSLAQTAPTTCINHEGRYEFSINP